MLFPDQSQDPGDKAPLLRIGSSYLPPYQNPLVSSSLISASDSGSTCSKSVGWTSSGVSAAKLPQNIKGLPGAISTPTASRPSAGISNRCSPPPKIELTLALTAGIMLLPSDWVVTSSITPNRRRVSGARSSLNSLTKNLLPL